MRHGRDGSRDLVVLAELGDCLEGMDNGEIVVFAHRAVISPFGLSLDRCLVSMYAPRTVSPKGTIRGQLMNFANHLPIHNHLLICPTRC